VMTAPALTVLGQTSIVEAAKIMESAQLKRLPVVDDLGRLIGMVTRRDLLKVFLRSDADIAREIVDEVLPDILGGTPDEIRVEVDDGVVTLSGELRHGTVAPTLVRQIERVDGVVDVVSCLTVGDDTDADAPTARWPLAVRARGHVLCADSRPGRSGCGDRRRAAVGCGPRERPVRAGVSELRLGADRRTGRRVLPGRRPTIRAREPVLYPDGIVVQDATLSQGGQLFTGLAPDGYVLINAPAPVSDRYLPTGLAAGHLAVIPASRIAMTHIGKPVPNAALLGASPHSPG
jgi:hypothetical protein